MSEVRMPQVDFSQIGPQSGERFPDITLPDQRGQLVDLHAHRDGHPALIVFYRSASW
jgi:peroxiredoxin